MQAQYLRSDPDYLSCKKKECKKKVNGKCVLRTCSASLSFHVINIRTDIEFVLFAGGFVAPCILRRSQPLRFANPNKPLYGHISSTDSTAKSVWNAISDLQYPCMWLRINYFIFIYNILEEIVRRFFIYLFLIICY